MTRDDEIELAWKRRDAVGYLARLRTRQTLRDRFAEAQNWRCCHCGNRMDGVGLAPDAPSLEHIIPVVRGGDDSDDNLAVCHIRCNSDRGDRWHEAELLVAQPSDAYCAVERWIRKQLHKGRMISTNQVLRKIPAGLLEAERNAIMRAVANFYRIDN